MIRYALLLAGFARISLVREMGFKTNFIIHVLVEIAWTFVTIFGLEIMFFHTDSISGWSKGEVFLIYAFYRLMSSLFALIFRNNIRAIPQLVNSGDLDILLTKPINSFFYISTRTIALDRISQIGISLLILIYASSLVSLNWTPLRLLTLVLLSLSGSLIRFAISSVIHTISIWLQKLQNLEKLELTLFGSARFPRQAFPQAYSQFMTFIIPVMFVAAIPAEIVLGRLAWWYIPLTVFISLASTTIAYLFFSFSLRHYSSASS